jgi:hypothetical protein
VSIRVPYQRVEQQGIDPPLPPIRAETVATTKRDAENFYVCEVVLSSNFSLVVWTKVNQEIAAMHKQLSWVIKPLDESRRDVRF